MQDMSDLRKSIAERLGSAAKSERPGAKAKMGGMKGFGDWAVSFTNITVERLPELRKLARDLKASIKVSSPSPNGYVSGTITRKYGSSEAPDLMASGKVKSMIQSLGGQLDSRLAGFSRPGAKAKMAADPALASFLKKWKRNEADNYHSENVVMLAKFVGTSGDVAEANRIMQQHDEMGYLTPELNSKRYALYTALKAKLLAKYPGVTFSRPGAKAKMAMSEVLSFVNRALQNAPVGLLRDVMEESLLRYWNHTQAAKKMEQRGDLANATKHRAEAGRETRIYTELWYKMGKSALDLKAITDALNKMTASRPGAKAKFGFKVGDRVAYKPYPAKTAGELVEIRKPTRLEGVEMQYGIKQASGAIMWVPEGMVVRASRPGAKAKMAYQPSEADWKKWLKGWTLRMPHVPDAGIRHFNSFEEAKRYADEKCGGFACVISHDGQRVASKSALAGATGSWTKHSRPGAKGSSKAKA